MKITRRIHSCVEISDGDTTVVLDPGGFGTPDNLAEVDAVLITHIHPDHVDADALTAARATNPELRIYGPEGLRELIDADYNVVADGDTFSLGSLNVEVRETPHEKIINSKELPENLGYLFNDTVLHPGDSMAAIPDMEVVLVPISGPWLRMLMVDEYLAAHRPKRFIGVHDGVDNDNGLTLRGGLLRQLAKDHGVEYLPLKPGESVEV
ncbi:MBL fold metallo-hydrolase [Corynebacterium doosanense]|uniref:Metallo-beta-lactamase domain-containing protein n=1 Tax=Corynebacterium doosanense CAU 212 = DSM 45436 TaxID=558173 RepID=A0A097IF21_9CORY|nr:MBL fold metallo-hydrolase [Corynebacterium doosanense]AIT60720.1 hypothetical protein CDOO_05230 [Corynebacterium doosanense CAU 212 = DSM 45436]